MAASSPALSNNSTDTNPTPIPTTSAATILPTTNASKNLRGLNKPKCIKCGNVARSRCPYQSCKSCCAKAQNPCHIHVLKGNSTFPDRASSSGSPLFDQQSTEASPLSSHRGVSIRQLSNNLQTTLRSRKPLTRKDAAVINEWRFSKLKEYKDSYTEAENYAFDRYMQNVTLLEEVFSVNSTLEWPTKNGSPKSSPNPTLAEWPTKHGSPISNPNPTLAEDSSEKMNSGLKLKFRSNQIRTEIFRKRIQYIVDQGLKKLLKIESNDGVSDLNESDELFKKPKKAKSLRAERAVVLSDLIDKLNKARNEEDLKSCLEMKDQVFNRHHMETCQVESKDIETSEQKDTLPKRQSNYSPPKWFSTTTIDQEAVNCIDAHFSSLEEIEDL